MTWHQPLRRSGHSALYEGAGQYRHPDGCEGDENDRSLQVREESHTYCEGRAQALAYVARDGGQVRLALTRLELP